MPLDPDLTQRAQAYASVFGDRPEVLIVLDDLVTQAGLQPDAQVRAGYMAAVHRCYAMRALLRRKVRSARNG